MSFFQQNYTVYKCYLDVKMTKTRFIFVWIKTLIIQNGGGVRDQHLKSSLSLPCMTGEKCRFLPSKRSLSSLRWFLLSRRISLSICSLIRRCSLASSLRQHAIFSHWRSLESPDKILSSSTKNAQDPALGVAMGGDLRRVKFTHSWGLYFPNSTTQFNGVQSDI